MATLTNPAVANLLNRLYAAAETTDAPLLGQIRKELAGSPLDDRKVTHLLKTAFISVSPEVGRFLYMMVRSKRPATIVEFGTSYGISAIHLAAAIRDNGNPGRIIATELEPNKAAQAAIHLAEAGLSDLVDLREGDAFDTLRTDPPQIDFLLLDGWKALYLPMLKTLEPRLSAGAVIIADDTLLMPDMVAGYLAHVRGGNGYLSVDVPMDDGLEMSIRL